MQGMDTNSLKLQAFHAPSGRANPFVTINSNGRIYLSTATSTIYEIDDKKYPAVKIYYDPQNKVVAIKPLLQMEEGALALKSPKIGGAFINGASFAVKYGLMEGGKVIPDYVGKYRVEKKQVGDIGKVLLFDLKAKHK